MKVNQQVMEKETNKYNLCHIQAVLYSVAERNCNFRSFAKFRKRSSRNDFTVCWSREHFKVLFKVHHTSLVAFEITTMIICCTDLRMGSKKDTEEKK